MRHVLLAWSGGKDSTMALHALRADPAVRVVGCVTAVTADYDRVSIHGIRRAILHAQAASLGLPLVEAAIATASDNDAYERAWSAALDEAEHRFGAYDAVAYGDLFLEDVRRYRDAQLARIGRRAVYPLWGEPTDALAHRFIDAGYEAYLTCVDTTQLAPEFAGRRFDHALLASLPATVDPCGERGEFHTCVVAGPLFSDPIAVSAGETILRDGRFQYSDLLLRASAPGPAPGQ
jgi:uncharacterized protein (TIGR00290 family)